MTNRLVPTSIKAALVVGAFTGTLVAVVNNQEALWKVAENVFQSGADFCREKVEDSARSYVRTSEDRESEDEEDYLFVGRADSETEEISSPGISQQESNLSSPDFTDISRVSSISGGVDDLAEMISLDE